MIDRWNESFDTSLSLINHQSVVRRDIDPSGKDRVKRHCCLIESKERKMSVVIYLLGGVFKWMDDV